MRQKYNFFFLLSVIFIFFLFFLPPVDTDLGWHLRYGEQIIKTANFHPNNFLTYYLAGNLWSNSYTLYQVLTYAIYKVSGLLGFNFAFASLMALSYFLFSSFSPKLSKINFLAFIAISLAGWNVFHLGFRSQIFTFTGLIIIFLILKAAKEKPQLLFLLPITFALWANLHGAFVLGLILLAIGTLDASVTKNFKLALPLSLSSLLSFLATLINPYGLGVYQEALTHLRVPLGSLIAEWVAPQTSVQILIISVTAAIELLIFFRKTKNGLFWSFLLLGFSLLALNAGRNLPFFALIASFTLMQIFETELIVLENMRQTRNLYVAIILLGIPYIIIAQIPRSLSISTNWASYCNDGMLPYPCGALDFVKREKLKGENVFSAYEWGGFLEWQLPQYKYFVDGRMPTWQTPEGKSPYTLYLEIIQVQPGYQKTLDKYKTDWLLIGAGSFLDIELSQKGNPIWHKIYCDKVAVIYAKK